MTSTDETTLVKSAWADQSRQEFRACAFFDDSLDCIRVIAGDCSVLEERISDRLTVLINNHPGEGERRHVGFTVKGAAHFCREQGWSSQASIAMTTLIDAILAAFPDEVVKVFVDSVFKPLVEEERIDRVDLRPLESVA